RAAEERNELPPPHSITGAERIMQAVYPAHPAQAYHTCPPDDPRRVRTSRRPSRRHGRTLRPETFEDHLIGPSPRQTALRFVADGPSQQWKPGDISQQQRGGGRQVVHRIGDELRAGGGGAAQIGQPAVSAA